MKNKKKIVIILLTIVLVVAIVAGVGIAVYKNKTSSEVSNDIDKLESKYSESVKFEKAKQGTDDIAPVAISLSDKAYKEFVSFVNDEDAEYEYDDLYNMDTAMNLCKNAKPLKVSQHTGDIRVNGKFDADNFYDIVKKNTEDKLADMKATSGEDVFYTTYSDKEMKQICKDMIDAVNDIIAKNPDFDADAVSCFLSNVNLMANESADFRKTAGFNLSNNRFFYNGDIIDETRSLIENEMAYDILDEAPISAETAVMYHQMYYAFLAGCPDMNNDNLVSTGIAVDFKNDSEQASSIPDVNALSWYWTSDAAAELKMADHFGINPTCNNDAIAHLDLINYIVTLSNGENKYVDLLAFDKDYDELFDLLGAKTEDDKEEVIKMMYSIQIAVDNKDAFGKVYENSYNASLMDTAEQRYLTISVQDGYMTSLTKLFYKALAKQINAGNLTKQDAFCLMKGWEANVVKAFNQVYDRDDDTTISIVEAHHDFYDEYLEIQDKFLDLLCKENGLGVNDAIQQFEAYEIKNASKTPNADLAFLDNKDYINSLLEFEYDYPSVRELKKMANDYDQNGYPIAELEADRQNYSLY